jgi:hypothetical protein
MLLPSSKSSMTAAAAVHAGVPHTPPLHAEPGAHTTPQPPQFAGSVSLLTHALLHTAVPAGAVRGPQVPVARPVLASVQPWHDSAHGPEQHTPSDEHELLVHSRAAAQATPSAFLGTQVVPEQKSPAMQSASTAQVALHAVAPHTSGAQVVVTAVGHAPAPLQLAAAVDMPAAQLAARHDTVAAATAHAPPLAHAPVLPHGGAVAQRTSDNPAVTEAHVPLLPPVRAAEHALHDVLHALLQQNPSAQKPETHSLFAPHTVPLPLHTPPGQLTHRPPVHCAPATQLAAVVQVVVHAVAPQMNGVQLLVTAAGHAPAPLQLAATVATPPAQLAARHDTVAAATAHAPALPHNPVFPHGGADPQRASAAPTVIAAHVPLAPPVLAAEQALHAVVHALLQQNPSTQKPAVHWLFAAHAPPVAFLGAHVPVEQKSPAMQSVSTAQVVLHAVVPHTSGEQFVVTATGHAPAPLQFAAAVATPVAQLAARHDTVAAATAHAPPLAHAPVFPHGGAATQRVSVPPAVTGAHRPLLPPVRAAEQALHAVAHALLQQNPSAQNPDVHSLFAAHATPLALHTPPGQLTHRPPVHCAPATQFAAVVQVVAHAVAPQMNGVQLVVTAAGHAPAPLQVAAAVATPLAQLAGRHDTVAAATAHAPVLPHNPVFPHGGAATQRVSAAPAVIDAHVPLAPPVLAAEQALHAVVQALLQQNPSMQNPDAHPLAAAQVPPPAFLGVHVPAEQKSALMQSVSAVHVVLHAVAPHISGEQLVVTADGHAPAPLQFAAAVAMPPVQLATRHDTVATATAHRPPLAQAPVFPHGGAATQRLSVPPAVTGAQVPLAPPVRAAEHALQDVLHAASQQKPSTQKPDVHWLFAVHVPPLA